MTRAMVETTHFLDPLSADLRTPPVKLLLVDDQPANLLALEAVLDDLGDELVKAHSGEQALEILGREEFAAVLLDVHMTGIGGFETAARIRRREANDRTPIIFLTAHETDQQQLEQAYSLGAVDYLVKPVVPVILRAKVATLIDLFRKREQIKYQSERLRHSERREFEAKLTLENRRLRQSEERFRGLARHAPVGIFLMDAAGLCRFVNARWCELAGMAPEAAEGEGWMAALHPDDRERVGHEWSTATRLGSEFASEYRFCTPQGHLSWLRGGAVPLRDDAGEITGYVGTVTDITDQKAAEETLRESEQRFSRFMQHLPGLAWIKDRDGRYVYVNESAARAFGMPTDRLYGKKDEEIFPPATAAVFRDNDRRALDGETAIQVVESLEHEDRTFHHSAVAKFPIPGRDGSPAFIGGMAIDITERLRAEEGLHFLAEAGRLLSSSLDYETTLTSLAKLSVPRLADWCGVHVCEADGTIRQIAVAHADPAKVEWARELAQRYPTEPSAPRGVPAVLRSGKPELISEVTDEMLVAGARDPDHLAMLQSLGIRSVMIVPLVARDRTLGAITFVAADSRVRYGPEHLALAQSLARRAALAIDNARLYRDETQLRRQAEEGDRRKNEFLAMLAHELRNPLAPVRNAVEILRLARNDESVLEQTRSVIERQVRHLVRLVDDLLDISRVNRNKIRLRREHLDLLAQVRAAVDVQRASLEEAGLQLSLTCPSKPLWVDADPTRLSQIIDNLLGNARKFTNPGGSVRVAVTEDGGRAVVRVEDSGIGLAAGVLPKLWQAFAQADTAMDRPRGGLGLGLALVKGLVDMHGGDVGADSEGPGKGAAFWFALPLLAAPAVEAIPTSPTPYRAATRRRILVIEDNIDAAQTLRRLLELAGATVRIAVDGPTGLEAAQQDLPDLVLCDLGLPRMTGYEVAAALRADPATADLFLVALSGYGQPEDKERSRAAGFDQHVVKPAEPEDILRLLSQPRRVSSQCHGQ